MARERQEDIPSLIITPGKLTQLPREGSIHRDESFVVYRCSFEIIGHGKGTIEITKIDPSNYLDAENAHTFPMGDVSVNLTTDKNQHLIIDPSTMPYEINFELEPLNPEDVEKAKVELITNPNTDKEASWVGDKNINKYKGEPARFQSYFWHKSNKNIEENGISIFPPLENLHTLIAFKVAF